MERKDLRELTNGLLASVKAAVALMDENGWQNHDSVKDVRHDYYRAYCAIRSRSSGLGKSGGQLLLLVSEAVAHIKNEREWDYSPVGAAPGFYDVVEILRRSRALGESTVRGAG